jgi:hypothetical protein
MGDIRSGASRYEREYPWNLYVRRKTIPVNLNVVKIHPNRPGGDTGKSLGAEPFEG